MQSNEDIRRQILDVESRLSDLNLISKIDLEDHEVLAIDGYERLLVTLKRLLNYSEETTPRAAESKCGNFDFSDAKCDDNDYPSTSSSGRISPNESFDIEDGDYGYFKFSGKYANPRTNAFKGDFDYKEWINRNDSFGQSQDSLMGPDGGEPFLKPTGFGGNNFSTKSGKSGKSGKFSFKGKRSTDEYENKDSERSYYVKLVTEFNRVNKCNPAHQHDHQQSKATQAAPVATPGKYAVGKSPYSFWIRDESNGDILFTCPRNAVNIRNLYLELYSCDFRCEVWLEKRARGEFSYWNDFF